MERLLIEYYTYSQMKTGWWWLDLIIYGSYLGLQYYAAVRSGIIDPPCMRQFIPLIVIGGFICLYYATKLSGKSRSFDEIMIMTVMLVGYYTYSKLGTKGSKNFILSLYTKRRIRTIPEEDCPICLETFVQDQEARKCLHCRKIFHEQCLEEWCRESNICPHCRHDYS